MDFSCCFIVSSLLQSFTVNIVCFILYCFLSFFCYLNCHIICYRQLHNMRKQLFVMKQCLQNSVFSLLNFSFVVLCLSLSTCINWVKQKQAYTIRYNKIQTRKKYPTENNNKQQNNNYNNSTQIAKQ